MPAVYYLFCFLGLRPRASTCIPVTDLDLTSGPSLKIVLLNNSGPEYFSLSLLKLYCHLDFYLDAEGKCTETFDLYAAITAVLPGSDTLFLKVLYL